MNVIDQAEGPGWTAIHGDSCEVLPQMQADSVGYSIYSPPFASLYVYSGSDRDLGNCRSDEEFFAHYGFILADLLRITKPGRNMSIHCMDLPTSKARDGEIGLRDFPGDIIRACEAAEDPPLAAANAKVKIAQAAFNAAGPDDSWMQQARADLTAAQAAATVAYANRSRWIWHAKATIRKDPVTAMQRTKALGLLHKQIRKDSAMSRMGIPDYVLTFRKTGTNAEPIAHTNEEFPVSLWQQWAEPIWTIGDTPTDIDMLAQWAHLFWGDINPSDTIQFRSARENADERHVCPLQTEVIRRCIRLWSNPGDVVLSPFGGIGSEPYVAIEEGRKAVAVELKKSYFGQMCRNLAAASAKAKQPSLFDNVGGI